MEIESATLSGLVPSPGESHSVSGLPVGELAATIWNTSLFGVFAWFFERESRQTGWFPPLGTRARSSDHRLVPAS